MSAPMNLSAYQLKQISNALDALSKIRNETGVEIGGFGGVMEIHHIGADVVLNIEWDDANDEYRIDDRSGS
ncbi:hypothetical protein ACIRON_02990 [Nocardioides sp. NPDC101246]|uniref:hypothetical protein n=1 Tax=Nocardioides sp. NPDC101246 TaxID=3364336 RepID=UPI00382C66B3